MVTATATAVVTVNREQALATATVTTSSPNLQTATASDEVIVVKVGQQATAQASVSVTSLGPTVSAGGNFAVEAGAAFTIVGISTPAGAAITSREWRVGTSVVATGATLALNAPIGLNKSTRVYTFVVTDANNATSTSSVSITFLAATRRLKVNGVIRPSIRRASDGIPSGGGTTGGFGTQPFGNSPFGQ